MPRLFQIGGKWGNSIACLASKRDGFENINSKKHGLKFEGTKINTKKVPGMKGEATIIFTLRVAFFLMGWSENLPVIQAVTELHPLFGGHDSPFKRVTFSPSQKVTSKIARHM